MPIEFCFKKRHLLFVLYLILGFFLIDLGFVVVGKGIHVEAFGVSLRSTTIELPLIIILSSSFLALFLLEKYKEAVLVAGALIVTAGVGEGLLYVLDHPFSKPFVEIARWYEPSEIFGHQLAKNFDGLGPLNIPIRTNSLGFRDEEYLPKRQVDETRVLVLGDSFTLGWGVPSHETFVKQLETKLNGASKGKVIKILNTGVPGWGLNQYFLVLKNFGEQFSADIVVLAYFLDDLSGPLLETIPADQQYSEGVKYKGGPLHLFRLYNFSKVWTDRIRYKNRTTREPYLHSLNERRKEWGKRKQYLMSSSHSKEMEVQQQHLFSHLERIKNLSESQGAQLVMLYIPDISQLHHPEFQYINQVLRELAGELTIPFMDMTPIFQRSLEVQTYYLWPQDPHTNALGHLKMAETLEKIICAIPSRIPLSCRDS